MVNPPGCFEKQHFVNADKYLIGEWINKNEIEEEIAKESEIYKLFTK